MRWSLLRIVLSLISVKFGLFPIALYLIYNPFEIQKSKSKIIHTYFNEDYQ